MKKSNLLKGVAAMAMGLAAVGCSHEIGGGEADLRAQIIAEYNEMFIKTFGKPASNQDWGFGGGTRAAATWTDNHSDDWFTKLDFELPASYKTLTASENTLRNGNAYYVPADFSGTINFDNFNGDVYVAAEITNFSGNPGKVNVYVLKGGAWKKGTTAGSLTIYNQGTVELGPWDLQSADNIPVIYNGGTLKIGDTNNNANISNSVKIYSKTDITIYGKSNSGEYEAVDLKCSLDIHGTVKVPTGNLKIQNSQTQHVCGLDVAGILDMTQGKLESSYIKAEEIRFDGSYIWLTAGGHVKADVIRMPNSATAIYGESTSTGLIEVKDVYFQNTNNFDDSFSANIYFKITGEIDFTNSTKFGGQGKHYASVEAYNNENTTLKGYNDSDSATGNPACGNIWTVGTPTTTPVDEFVFAYRVFAEDLTVEQASDFDFNDVVFDVYYNQATTQTQIVLQAAGGTLPLTVAGVEVHGAFGLTTTNVMVNTGTVSGLNIVNDKDPVTIKTFDEIVAPADIEVKVTKAGSSEPITLIAPQGQPTAKFVVTDKVKWCNEREDIKKRYPSFMTWVGNKDTEWYTEEDIED